MKRRAFTLIELLVVVAITTVLISILLPSLSGSRTRAKITVCESHQRQIALAASMYRDQHRAYPRAWAHIEDDVAGVRSCTLDRDRADYNLWPVLFAIDSSVRFEDWIDNGGNSRAARKPHPVTADRLMGNGQQHHGYRKWSAARPDGSVGEWKYPQFP